MGAARVAARRPLRRPCAEKQSAPEALASGRANVTLHLLPCTARAGNASGIQSIPAIQACARRAASPATDRRHANRAGAGAMAARAAVAEFELLGQADADLAQAQSIAIDRDACRREPGLALTRPRRRRAANAAPADWPLSAAGPAARPARCAGSPCGTRSGACGSRHSPVAGLTQAFLPPTNRRQSGGSHGRRRACQDHRRRVREAQ
jgi:hypothetical protein